MSGNSDDGLLFRWERRHGYFTTSIRNDPAGGFHGHDVLVRETGPRCGY